MQIVTAIIIALIITALVYRHFIAVRAKQAVADAAALKNSAEKAVAADVDKVENVL